MKTQICIQFNVSSEGSGGVRFFLDAFKVHQRKTTIAFQMPRSRVFKLQEAPTFCEGPPF